MHDQPSMSVDEVLAEERATIHASEDDIAALCISGGGIRSATFALGVLQGLAQAGLLRKFHYLSTVSGGGYIGSWLSAWIYHKQKNTAAVEMALAGGAVVEPREIFNLRRYSNYLTPRLGALSRDTWVAFAIFIRNLLLNWAVLGPIMFAALLVPRIVSSSITFLALFDSLILPLGIGFFLVGFLLLVIGLLLPKTGRRTPGLLFVACFGSVMLSIFSFSVYFADPLNYARFWFHAGDLWSRTCQVMGFSSGDGSVRNRLLTTVAILIGLLLLHEIYFRFVQPAAASGLRLFLAVTLGLLVQGLLVFEMMKLFVKFTSNAVHASFAGPLLALAILGGGYIFTGISSKDLDDLQREWLSSLGTVFLMYALLWSVVSSFVLFVPAVFDLWNSYPTIAQLSMPVSTIGTIITGATTAWQGFRVQPQEPRSANDQRQPSASLLLKISLPLLILFLTLLLSRAGDPILRLLGATNDSVTHDAIIANTNLTILVSLFVLAVTTSLFLSRFIDVNYFSMHGFYRNRLIRAYLGASRNGGKRRPDSVTGFDPKDDLKMDDLKDQRPLHVINMALNLVKGKELAWQNRKAESLIATPYRTGAAGEPGSKGDFRPSSAFGHSITLGTAMAISGAAASPNMGFNSSPLVAFLMTLLNVRLGWWLPNPKREQWRRRGPGLGLMWILMEAFGWTDDTRAFVNVSDGGHFENLAAYEMIRRRCRFIVISDGSCDRTFGFEDLNNLIRKARVDFQTEIVFDSGHLEGIAKQTRRWARAEIQYPSSNARGELLYLKPVVFDPPVEPPDVLEYRSKNGAFPHEPTLDQFFTESQFESYRRLGLFTVESLALGEDCEIKTLFDLIAQKSRKISLEKALSPVDS